MSKPIEPVYRQLMVPTASIAKWKESAHATLERDGILRTIRAVLQRQPRPASPAPQPMSDAQLADWLGLNPVEAAELIPKLTAKKRAIYEHIHTKYMEALFWQNGVAQFPSAALNAGRRT